MTFAKTTVAALIAAAFPFAAHGAKQRARHV